MSAKSKTIPVPVGGWNARDRLENMGPEFAVRLINIFPDTDTIRLRSGSRIHTPSGLGSGSVETLVEWSGMTGGRKLLAAANGNIFDVSTISVAATDLSGAFGAFTSNRWQSAQYLNTTVLVNGADQPKQYDGTTLTDATYTGIADDATLITVNVYKSRLYFVQKNTLSVWYGSAGAITGALTEFPVGDFCELGGSIMFAGSYTRDTGTGYEDLFVIVTSMGEILVYTGLDPADTEWALVGHYYAPPPLSRRSFVNYNADLIIVTYLGLLPLSRIFSGIDAQSDLAFITDNIRNAFRLSAKAYATNAAWDAIVYPLGSQIIVNIPISAIMSEQYVVNLTTGAWTRYTGMDAACWCLFNGKPYFGGHNGKVYQGDYGTSDAGNDIRFEVKSAFNYFGDKGAQKLFSMIRPIITANDRLSLLCNVDTDFADRAITNSVVTSDSAGSQWDEAIWDESPWGGGSVITDDWYAIGDIGRCASIKMQGLARDIGFSISAIDVVYETGGIL